MALKAFCDGTVFGDRLGDGVPGILALHGWGRSRADFAAALAGLDAIALDLPGFGASPPPAESGGARAYAASLSPVLSEIEGTGDPCRPLLRGKGGCVHGRHPR